MATTNTQWITSLLDTMIKEGKKGKLLEVRNDNNKLIVSMYIDQMTYENFEKYKKNIDLRKFFGKFELNYANGSCIVRSIISLTEEDVKSNPNICKL